MTCSMSVPQSPQDVCDYGVGLGAVSCSLPALVLKLLLPHAISCSLPPRGVHWPSWASFRGFFLDLQPPPTAYTLHRGFVNVVSLGKRGWVCTLATPVRQVHLAALPPRYFFLPSPPLLFPSFFFLKTHCTTFQNSLAPSHILGDWSSPHFFFGHNSQSQNLSIWDSAWLQSCPFSLDLALLVLGGTSAVIAPFLRRIW